MSEFRGIDEFFEEQDARRDIGHRREYGAPQAYPSRSSGFTRQADEYKVTPKLGNPRS